MPLDGVPNTPPGAKKSIPADAAVNALVPLPFRIPVSVVAPVPPFAIGNVPDTLVVKLANVVEVEPVPPFAIGNAVPDKLIAIVPLVVIADPADKKVGTDIPTEVTVPVFDVKPDGLVAAYAPNAVNALAAVVEPVPPCPTGNAFASTRSVALILPPA